MGKIVVVFGVKAVTYAIKHGLGLGHSLKSRSYQVRVKNIHHWMSYSTQSDKFGVPVPKQDHVTSITQGRADTGFLPGVGAHYTSKLKIETY